MSILENASQCLIGLLIVNSGRDGGRKAILQEENRSVAEFATRLPRRDARLIRVYRCVSSYNHRTNGTQVRPFALYEASREPQSARNVSPFDTIVRKTCFLWEYNLMQSSVFLLSFAIVQCGVVTFNVCFERDSQSYWHYSRFLWLRMLNTFQVFWKSGSHRCCFRFYFRLWITAKECRLFLSIFAIQELTSVFSRFLWPRITAKECRSFLSVLANQTIFGLVDILDSIPSFFDYKLQLQNVDFEVLIESSSNVHLCNVHLRIRIRHDGL